MKGDYNLALLIVLILILVYVIVSGRSGEFGGVVFAIGGLIALTSLSYFSSKQITTGRGVTDDQNDGLIKLKEGMYAAKLADKPFYAIAEKLTINNYGFWLETAKLWARKSVKDTVAGVGHFEKSVEDFKKNMSNKLAGETWIIYITTRDPLDSLQQDINSMVGEIVIAVTVKTGEKSTVTSHMGVQKGVNYRRFTVAEKDDPATYMRLKLAAGLSMPLHSFASKVMLKLNPNRKYQINTPVDAMLNIFLSKIPKEYIHYSTISGQKQRVGAIYAVDHNISDEEELKKLGYPEAAKEIDDDIDNFNDLGIDNATELGRNYAIDSFKRNYESNKKYLEYPSIINYSTSPFHMDVGDVFNSDREEDSWIKYHDSLYPTTGNDWVAVDIQPLSDIVKLDPNYHL